MGLTCSTKPVRRERLCELFYDIPDDPRAALRWSLSKIRVMLGEDASLLCADRERVSLDASGFMLDIDRKGERDPIGRITRLEDTDGDGRFDKSVVFVDHLIFPRAIAAAYGGVFFVADNKLSFARDTDGDWPSFPLELGDTSTHSVGGVVTVELLDADESEAFNSACRAAGARFSGGAMACAALAEHHLTGTETFHGFTPSDTRVGDAQAMSAGWYASLFPVSVPVGGGDFAQMARAAQKSFDANKQMSVVPFQRVLELATPEELGITLASKPSMMVSLMDFRKMADADTNRLGIYLDNLSLGSINTWIIRHADKTTVTVSFPETPEARHSVHHYIGVLRQAFGDAAELTEQWGDQYADQAFAHSA